VGSFVDISEGVGEGVINLDGFGEGENGRVCGSGVGVDVGVYEVTLLVVVGTMEGLLVVGVKEDIVKGEGAPEGIEVGM
jgi:hypothetical protein